jgi:hypothetical protein
MVLLDRDDPRVLEGERISLAILRTIAERCRAGGVRFYVAIIPSKESVLRPAAEALGLDRAQPALREVWQAEAGARARALDVLAHAGIRAIDTLPALRAVAAAGVGPYLDSAETHPIGPAIARSRRRLPDNWAGTTGGPHRDKRWEWLTWRAAAA